MPGPLRGLKVLDCSRGTAGPRATGFLADYGADVLWVEPPGGDPYRDALAVPYSVFNRNKRSITLDLRDPDGREELHRLLGSADVFVQSWRPGVASRLGLDYATVHAAFPGLICCAITGFGDDGPHRNLPGYESLVHAVVGTMGEQYGHDRTYPIFEGLPFAGLGAAYLATIGTLSAVLRRGTDGAGRLVETSLLDGALAYLSMLWANDDLGSPPNTAGGRRQVVRAYECGDGEYVGVHTGAVGAFDRLMALLGLAEHFVMEGDGPSMGVILTPEQQKIMDEDLVAIFKQRPRAEWVQLLLDADVCVLPELHPCQVFDEPQTRHNEMVAEVEDAVLGRIQQVAPPIRFSATPHSEARPAPSAGGNSGELDVWLSAAPWHQPTAGAEPVANRPLLADLKILDLGAYYAGPYAPRLLADLGADVIKVEPLTGDQLRGLDRPFGSAQAGKRAIALDLKDPDAQEIGRQLAGWADVVHHNMRPGAADRLGLGVEQVRSLNPAAVYHCAPGWGSSGPDMNRQSFAPLMSGYVGANYEVAGQFNPPLMPTGNEDPGNGLLGAVGILMALVHRQRTGSAQYLETPQLNAAMVHVAHIVRRCSDGAILNAENLDTMQLGTSALDRLYETADGWICLVASSAAEISALSTVIGVDLLADERFATRAARGENDYELADVIGTPLVAMTSEQALAAMRAAGVPAAVPVPRNDATFLKDPENHRTGRVAECPHPRRGHVRELAVLVRVSDSTPPPHRLAPSLGEHTEEILRMLGHDGDAIDKLKARGVAR